MEKLMGTVMLMLDGTQITLQIFFITLIMALPVGLLVALGRISKLRPMSLLMEFYIWLMRGTPLMLQLLFVYFALPMIGIRLPDIAAALLSMAEQALQPDFAHWGVYHFAGEPHVSWHGFATSIFNAAVAQGLFTRSPQVNAIATRDYPTSAQRPANSRLDCSRINAIFGIMPSNWQSALSDLRPYMPT